MALCKQILIIVTLMLIITLLEGRKKTGNYRRRRVGKHETQRIRKCPKLKNKQDDNGLPCNVKIPQRASIDCKQHRSRELLRNKFFFKLTSPKEQPELIAPMLNQTVKATSDYFMTDPFTAHWFNLYYIVLHKKNLGMVNEKSKKKFAMMSHSYETYIEVYNMFSNMIKNFRLPQYFKNDASHQFFEKMVEKKSWKTDRFFAQQRLAGLNPLAIKAVSLNGAVGIQWNLLKQTLNGDLNWEKEIQGVVGKNYCLEEMLSRRLVYVLNFPLLNDVKTSKDYLKDYQRKPRKMRNDTSPIAIFAVCKKSSCHSDGELLPVAIQIDYKKDSAVYTPRDGYKWDMAKAQVQLAELIVTQVNDHLARCHIRIEPICVGINRHLSTYHPLHQILKFHCRGLLPVNSNGVSALLEEGQFFDMLTSFGSKGAAEMFNKAFTQMKWGDNEFHSDIQRRGLDDKSALPYFPFRDDGEIMAYIIERFSKEFIRLYYKRNVDVARDFELQNLMNELSAEGKSPPDGGKGKIKGLPSRFSKRYQLSEFLKSFLWVVVQHSVINYPLIDYGAFVPNMASKLYYDPRTEKNQNVLYMLPGGLHAAIQATLVYGLGSLHYDELFDYSSQLNDAKARKIVHKYYKILKEKVKPKLEKRNKLRVKRGQLPYMYLVPGFITNSIST